MRPLFPVVAIALMLSGCQQPKQIYADQAYVRLSAVKNNPAAAYFILHGGAADNSLLSVTSPAVIKSELHQNMASGGMTSMTPLKSVPLPAGAKLVFAPGGKHVMFYGVDPTVKPGGTLPLVFTFADNLRIQVDASVIGAGDPIPKN